MKTSLSLIFAIALLSSCYKEQKTADTLQGNWTISRLQWANGQEIPLTGDVHRIEFLPCEQAYTATCTGVYSLDYADTLRPDLRDTFRFEVKDDEFSISAIKASVPSNNFTSRFLRQRYTIESLDKSNLTFKRIKTHVDSTAGLFTATKN